MGSTLLWLVVSGLVTGLGGVALAVVRHPGPRLVDTPLGATAGIILVAMVCSLLVPPLEDGSVWEVVARFAVAAAVLAALAATIPHVRGRIVQRTLRRDEHRAALDVVVDEIVSESHGRGHEREATAGVVAGLASMMLLDTALS